MRPLIVVIKSSKLDIGEINYIGRCQIKKKLVYVYCVYKISVYKLDNNICHVMQ